MHQMNKIAEIPTTNKIRRLRYVYASSSVFYTIIMGCCSTGHLSFIVSAEATG